MNKQNFLEGLIVFSVMTGILLPVRLLFVAYVSDNWFGSFGIIAAISVTMIILTKKGKLGKFGEIFERQLNKLQHGKRAKIVYGQAVFFLLILGGTIYAIELGNTVYSDLKDELLAQNQEFSDSDKILAMAKEVTLQDWINGFIGMILAVFFAFPQLSAVFAVLNDSSQGWVLHFYTVAFVEYLEIFGILLLYRFYLPKKNAKLSKNTGKTLEETK